jgi:hypothetical protein
MLWRPEWQLPQRLHRRRALLHRRGAGMPVQGSVLRRCALSARHGRRQRVELLGWVDVPAAGGELHHRRGCRKRVLCGHDVQLQRRAGRPGLSPSRLVRRWRGLQAQRHPVRDFSRVLCRHLRVHRWRREHLPARSTVLRDGPGVYCFGRLLQRAGLQQGAGCQRGDVPELDMCKHGPDVLGGASVLRGQPLPRREWQCVRRDGSVYVQRSYQLTARFSYWVIDAERRTLGPMGFEGVRDLIVAGRLDEKTPVSTDGRSWTPLGQLSELAVLLGRAIEELQLEYERLRAQRLLVSLGRMGQQSSAAVFGVDEGASLETYRDAFLSLHRAHHPTHLRKRADPSLTDACEQIIKFLGDRMKAIEKQMGAGSEWRS